MKDYELIFIYNADGTVFGQLTDFAHKLISPQTYECNLCKITYGNISMKKEWKEYIQNLPLKTTFLHKDEWEKKYPDAQTTQFPAAFLQEEDQITSFLTSHEINSAQNLDDLKNLIQTKLSQHHLI